MYVQQFLFYVWEEKDTTISLETVARIELRILQSSHNEFLNLWDSLTLNQKKTLKLIILTGGKEMFYANALQAVDLNAGSQVTRSLSKLLSDDIVLKNNNYKIQDVMFTKWIHPDLFMEIKPRDIRSVRVAERHKIEPISKMWIRVKG
jgi:hypothetical protein